MSIPKSALKSTLHQSTQAKDAVSTWQRDCGLTSVIGYHIKSISLGNTVRLLYTHVKLPLWIKSTVGGWKNSLLRYYLMVCDQRSSSTCLQMQFAQLRLFLKICYLSNSYVNVVQTLWRNKHGVGSADDESLSRKIHTLDRLLNRCNVMCTPISLYCPVCSFGKMLAGFIPERFHRIYKCSLYRCCCLYCLK